MADPQDLPDEHAAPAPQAPGVPPAETPPAKKATARKAPAKKAPVKKAPVKKAPAKKAPVKPAPAGETLAGETPANTAPTNDTPANEARTGEAVADAPATKVAAPTPPPLPLAETNGSAADVDGAKQAAAQAKSTVEQAGDNIRRPAPPPEDIDDDQSPFSFIVALVMIALAVLWVRRLRRG